MPEAFCYVGHPTPCEHPRCRARRCEQGHELIAGGFCETCDLVPNVSKGQMLEALLKAGLGVKRVSYPAPPEDESGQG